MIFPGNLCLIDCIKTPEKKERSKIMLMNRSRKIKKSVDLFYKIQIFLSIHAYLFIKKIQKHINLVYKKENNCIKWIKKDWLNNVHLNLKLIPFLKLLQKNCPKVIAQRGTEKETFRGSKSLLRKSNKKSLQNVLFNQKF